MNKVKPFLRIALWSVAGIFLVWCIGLLGINLYIQSPGVQRDLRDSFSESLGLPLEVFRITFTPWDGLTFEGVTVGSPDSETPILKAGSLKIRCDYLALLRRKIIVREIVLRRVDLKVPLAAMKESLEGNKRIAVPSPTPDPSQLGSSTPTEIPRHRKSLTIRDTLTRRFWVEIQKFKLKDATITVVRSDGATAAVIHDLDSTLNFQHGNYLGRVHAESATIGETINVDDIGSPVRFHGGSLALEDICAKISGGDLNGTFNLDFSNSELPYRLEIKASGIDVNELTQRNSSFLDRAHGTLEGSFELTGAGRDSGRAAGAGTLEIKSGYLDQYPMLQEIGRWTQIDELQRLDLEEAESSFRVVGSRVHVDSIRLISKNCQINLAGTVEDSQKLDLKGRLTITQFLSQKIPNELEDNFVTTDDGRSRYLDFEVSGSVQKPETNLYDRIIGDKRKLLQRLLHGSHTDRSRPQPVADSNRRRPNPEK
ncbi:MAG TPA: AsmA family protein [Chthoniobacterales bacterium]|nr:AsmA family protein [Chthoniobacterales bacterium]